MGKPSRHFVNRLSEFPASPAGYLLWQIKLEDAGIQKKIRNGEPKLVCGISWRQYTNPIAGGAF